MIMDIIDDLKWRGAINQETDEKGLKKLLAHHKISVYAGIDPTGDSMHVGHLIPFMILKRFQKAGFHPVILIGGMTGAIGDPSGKKAERTLQTQAQVKHNEKCLTKQAKQLFDKDGGVTIVNNYDWLSKLNLETFLRKFGKLFNVNDMIHKEIIKSRLAAGISFTEFTYQILQSIDFLHLYKTHDVHLEVGGSDQWGNITDGIKLIRKIEGPKAQAYGLTIPLMLKSDGTKFGKTAGGAVWLDPKKTSPYEFYQFWFNTADADVIKYLKYFTFLSHDEITKLAKITKKTPWKRVAQRKLAEEVTKFVHGEKGLKQAQKITDAFFHGNIKSLTDEEAQMAFHGMPSVDISSKPEGIIDWLVDAKIEPSKRQARQDVKSGAVHINGNKVQDMSATVDPASAFHGKFVVVRKGKKHYWLAKVTK